MQALVLPYVSTLAAMLAAASLLLAQLLVADVAAMRARHVAGTPIPPDLGRYHYRAARAHANTNESITAFALIAAVGVLTQASASWLGYAAWLYVFARIAHMTAYYAHRKAARSTAFGISIAAQLWMIGIVATTLREIV